TRSLRAVWALQELDIPCELVTVNLLAGEHRQPAFLKLNPAGKVPVLVDGERVLTESVAIVLYLAEKYPERGLIPSEPSERAQLYRWLLFTVTELEQPLWRISRHTSLYPPDRRLPADITLAREEFLAMAAVLAGQLAERPFVLGDRLSAADLVLAYTLDWGNELKLLEERAPLRAYLERMYARPRAPQRIAQALASISHGASAR
ncbi:MAG TPA: glutathione S-transferase family protein, partial [Polyangiaceae bacterium]|nr:glutathione S-transferase family protein [Polyangiaceae bacterium]